MFAHALRSAFPLEEGVTYLNHGGFGVVPRSVLAAQAAWRDVIEAQPARFFQEHLAGALSDALDAVGVLLGASKRDLVFVDNATTGANAVLGSLDLATGDVILTTNHVYPGVRSAIREWCRRTGAVHRAVEVPHPIPGAEALADLVASAITGEVRVVMIDHMASASAVVFPVAAIVAAAHGRGVPVFVDGAHAPGQLPVDLDALGADWWVGNLHKWAFAPRGTAVLYARPGRREHLNPPVISLGYDAGWPDNFHWPGTRDFSGWLAAPAGLAFAKTLGGFDAIRAYTHALQREATTLIAQRWGVTPSIPVGLRGAMSTLPVPDVSGADAALALHRHLREEHAIEVPVFAAGERVWVRIGVAPYSAREDFVRLARAVVP